MFSARRKLTYNYHFLKNNLAIVALGPLRLVLALPLFLTYIWLFNISSAWHFASDLTQWWQWLLALIWVDFTFYLYHTAAHTWNLVWGAHLVHHLSADLNLSVGGRDGIAETLFRQFTFLPLAFIGVPLEYMAALQLVTFGLMFWLHTETVGKLGWLEYIFVTPSQHRVHHYKLTADHTKTKNFGGVLSIWDRLFGTFMEEKSRACEYGVKDFPPTLGITSSHTHFYKHLLTVVRQARGFEKLKLLFSDRMPVPMPVLEDKVQESSSKKLDCLLAIVTLYCASHVLRVNSVRIYGFVVKQSPFEMNYRLFGWIASIVIALMCLSLSIGKLPELRSHKYMPGLLLATLIYLWAAESFYFDSPMTFLSVIVSSRIMLFLCLPEVSRFFQSHVSRLLYQNRR